jgi:hypothetical protein
MKKSLPIILATSALLVSAAGATASATRHTMAPKTITVVMRDPGCHWFSVGSGFKTSLNVTGPVSLRNLDMAALKIAGPNGVQLDRVGGKIVLSRGTYRITMVGQARDDNHLRLVVR